MKAAYPSNLFLNFILWAFIQEQTGISEIPSKNGQFFSIGFRSINSNTFVVLTNLNMKLSPLPRCIILALSMLDLKIILT